jgi:hypothetical protein
MSDRANELAGLLNGYADTDGNDSLILREAADLLESQAAEIAKLRVSGFRLLDANVTLSAHNADTATMGDALARYRRAVEAVRSYLKNFNTTDPWYRDQLTRKLDRALKEQKP